MTWGLVTMMLLLWMNVAYIEVEVTITPSDASVKFAVHCVQQMSVKQPRRYELKERARRQEETRRRIVAATAALHEEVGPARTTVAEIARRGGVQRLTVYTHFPDERELPGPCQALTLGAPPPPDFADALASADPRRRVEQALGLLYAWYRSA